VCADRLILAALFWWTLAEARDLDAARRHFRNAMRAFAVGAYRDAADEYILSYQASDDPLLLYNIAASYRLSQQRPQALRAYRMYLKLFPEADNRAECEEAMAELLAPQPSPHP
jgi:hypothetical protein